MALFPINEAIKIASNRKLLPSALSSAEMREAVRKDVLRRAVFSARTTSAEYLGKMRGIVTDYVSGKTDMAKARLRLKLELARLGYSPTTGFPGGAPVPPALAGTLRDLSSDKRLNLILETQWGIAYGTARAQRETTPERFVIFPAWELRRKEFRKVPRGLSEDAKGNISPVPGDSWEERWQLAGGELVGGRMVAWKWSPIWKRLGDSKLFDDGLDTYFTPYWFNSGAGIFEISRPVAERLLGPLPVLKGGPADNAMPPIPSPAITIDSLPANIQEELKQAVDAYPENGKLTFESATATALQGLREKLAARTKAKKRRPNVRP
jgi:hypothetical protein